MVAAALTIKIMCAWLLADAMSGLVHWFIDKKLGFHGFLLNVAEDNELHHAFPRAMIELSLRQNLSTSWLSLAIAGLLFLCSAPTVIWLAFIFLFSGNLVHRWAHTPRRDCPRVVRWLQRVGIFQSQDHHAAHHYAGGRPLTRAEASKRYCVMSNYVNGLLERL